MKNTITIFSLLLMLSACTSKSTYEMLARQQCERDAKAMNKDPYIECRAKPVDPSYEDYQRSRADTKAQGKQ